MADKRKFSPKPGNSDARWTQGLNPEQIQAVRHVQGPLLILAGAGSGKTTVLVSRTGRLLDVERVEAERVGVLTFTNKAARELKHRVALKLGAQAQKIWTGTFHSFGLQWMRRHHRAMKLPSSFGVIDSSDAEGIVRELLKDTRAQKDAFRIDQLLELMNQWREEAVIRGVDPAKLGRNDADEYEVMASALLPKYLRRLELLGVTDFSDLLTRPLQALRDSDQLRREFGEIFDFLMVDEFQDTNGAQLELVRELSRGSGNLAVVGDDDQSIYGWRGARVANILEFPREFPGAEVIRLERNYRSSPAILDLANFVIEKNEERHGKRLRSDPQAERGEAPEFFVYDSEDVEVAQTVLRVREFLDKGTPAHEIAILYRSNGQGGLLEGELRREAIPYAITGGQAFFDRKEVKDVLAYLRCSLAPNEVAFRRIINTPPRGIGETSIERLQAWSEKQGIRFHVSARKWVNAQVPEAAGLSIETLFSHLDRLPGLLLVKPPRAGEDAADSPGRRLLQFLNELGYRDYVRGLHREMEAFEKRWFALEVLGKVLDSFLAREIEAGRELSESSLVKFLDSMELRDQIEESRDGETTPKVQLLTLHACKGLEFDAVCLIGCEEDLLPHRTLGGDLSEERRLFYVGITRARKHLVLSQARQRRRFGRLQPVSISRFVVEIPDNLLTRYPDGARPLAAAARQDKLAQLFAKLDHRVAALASEQAADMQAQAETQGETVLRREEVVNPKASSPFKPASPKVNSTKPR